MKLEAAREEFSARRVYLDSATLGLPPDRAIRALQSTLDDWQAGTSDPTSFDHDIARCRSAYARLVGTQPERVAIVSQVSVVSGLVAAALGSGDEVVVAEEDFTSILFPFLVSESRGVKVRAVPLDGVLEAIGQATRLVAVSAVQSADGRLIDLDALSARASEVGALTYVDVTQAAGWLPLAVDRFDVTACGAYKWLCSPRGAGFATVRPELHERLQPIFAGWYAGEQPWDSVYRPPLRLAANARRYDASPAWHCYAAAAPTLELLDEVGVATIHTHNLGLANSFRAGLGMPPGDSAIVSLAGGGCLEALQQAKVACAGRAGRARLSFHLYNTREDCDAALSALAGCALT